MLIIICLYFMLIENYSSEWVLPDILMRNVTYVTYMYELGMTWGTVDIYDAI